MSYDDHSVYIMFDDLTEEAQQELKKFYKIDSITEMNWDMYPITAVPLPEKE